MASVLSEYFGYFDEYTKKYGDKVAVLMQVGSFYEVYGVDDGTNKLGNAEELSRILNVVLTRRSKKIQANSINNPLMLGFPCLALDKYTPVLLEEDYTVVVVNQSKTSLGIKRAVVEVMSPSIDMAASADNFLVMIYVDRYKHLGISAINILTGRSVVHECYSDKSDPDRSLDETVSFLKQYRPREAVIHGHNAGCIVSYLELDGIMCHTINNERDRRPNLEYQNSVLGLVFQNSSMLSNIEFVGLEMMPYALISYVMLIEFVYDHNPMLLKRMLLPYVFSASKRLVLSTSTADQLNITGQGRRTLKHTLLGVLDRCITRAGKRLLTQRILAPDVDPAEINRRYCQIGEFSELFGIDLQDIDRLLKRVVDIERLQRRMSVGIITPSELASLATSYEAILELDSLLRIRVNADHRFENLKVAMLADRERVERFVNMCNYAFDMDNMLGSEAAFNEGVFDEIDSLRKRIQSEMGVIEDFALSIGIDNPRIERHNSIGYCICVTGNQAKAIKRCKPDNGIVVKAGSSLSRITSKRIEPISSRIILLSDRLRTCTKRLYKATLEYLLSCSDAFNIAVKSVSNIDVIRSNVVVSRMYGYCRPELGEGSTSFVDAVGLRHPIIERIDDGRTYVPNDISLGKGCNGVILYSMNSCGKTSLLRALGLSVIMAQAGCFVPAKSFTFVPFRYLMTRILSRDNIMKGQSSFVAEMAELRAIIRRANDGSTLVLADEITHGTEHTSGSSIFVSSVETLAKRGVNFMFTTHLHSVYPFVKAVPNIRVLHLSVAFDDGKIVFERKLKDGPGGSIYGLEVCEFLGMDPEFIARAFQIRRMITPDKAEQFPSIPKPSKYNSKKMVQHCEMCGYYPKLPTDSPLDTHHVIHRSSADLNGMINGIHKNALSNLRVLCKQCHTREHRTSTAV